MNYTVKLISALLLLLTAVPTQATTVNPTKPCAALVIAHRGASGYRPEHTLAGYQLAIEQGADYLELDLVMTKDQQLIARHEPMLSTSTDIAKHREFANRKTKQLIDGVRYDDWFAGDFTLAELKTLRTVQTRSNRDQQYNGLDQISTLPEIIKLAKSAPRPIGLYIEIKHSTYHATYTNKQRQHPFGQYRFENNLLKILHKSYGNSAQQPIFIESFEVGNLQYLSKHTQLNLVQLIDGNDVNAEGVVTATGEHQKPYDFVVSGNKRHYADLLTATGLKFVKSYADVIAPWKPYLLKTQAIAELSGTHSAQQLHLRQVIGSTGFVEKAHEAGLQVHTWTFRNDDDGYGFADPKQEISAYLNLGVAGIFTDFPDTGVAARQAVANCQ